LTTGYGWEVETVEGTVIKFIESTYVEAKGMAIGRGGTRVLRFVARSPGSQEIRLQLRRPWDPPDKSLEHLKVTIRVR
jgi:predicted secreted protein